jgi:hypothetical protein
MLIGLIIACEIGFWVVLLSGLVARYLLGRRRLGAALLVAAPLVDLVLLTATTLDLARGATAQFAHGLAAAYIGFSVAFGHSVIRWTDERFAHRFAGGPAPARTPRHGPERTRHEWRQFGRAALAWAVACSLLGLAILVVGDAGRTAELQGWVGRLTLVLGVWAIWPVSYTLWPARPKRPRETPA